MILHSLKSIPCPACEEQGIKARAWHDHTIALEDKDGGMVVEGIVYVCFVCGGSTMKTMTYDTDNF